MPWTKNDVDRFKSGLTDAQKEQWVEVANSALQSCLDDGGSQDECEASAIRQANGVVGNGTYVSTVNQQIKNDANYRYETFNGRRHIVAPVVLLTAGVHHGSAGRILYTAEEISRMPVTWNGRPIPVIHPTDNDGNPLTCNLPGVLENQSVGRLFNVQFEQRNQRLKGEAWIDIQRAREVCQQQNVPDVVNMIERGQPVEVSTGLIPESTEQGGIWNDQEYDASAHNIHADHLALLPGGRGACSWEDGCGIRNKQGGTNEMKRTKTPKDQRMTQNQDEVVDNSTFIKDTIKQGFLFVDNVGFREVASLIQSKLDSMDNDYKIHFLEEVYDDGTFVYRIRNKESDTEKMYRRGYSMENGDVTFNDDVTEVRKQVDYVEVEQQMQQQADHKGGDNMSQNSNNQQTQNQGCCPEKIQAIINSEANGFTEQDKDYLQTLDEATIDKFPVGNPASKTQQDKEESAQMNNQEQQKQVTFDELLQNADAEIKQSIERGRELFRQERQQLVNKCMQSPNVQFTQEELQNMDHNMLLKIANSIVPLTHRGPAGGPPVGNTTQNVTDQYEEGIDMPWMNSGKSENQDSK